MKASRGYTLIELMIAVALFGIGMRIFMTGFDAYQASAERARAVEQLTRVLDQEMERMSACRTQRCLRAPMGAAAESWSRARVTKTVKPGPEGTLRVRITARNQAGARSLTALLGRRR